MQTTALSVSSLSTSTCTKVIFFECKQCRMLPIIIRINHVLLSTLQNISNYVYYLSTTNISKRKSIHNLYPPKRTSTLRLCSGLIQLISKTIRESRKQVRSLSSHTNTLRRRMPCDGSRPTLGSEQAKALQYGTAPVPRAQDVCDYRFAISYLRRLMSSIGQPDGCGGPCPGSRREWISTAKLKAFQSCQDGPDQLFRSWRQRVPPPSQGMRVQGSIPG
jgi:hypothetical protein